MDEVNKLCDPARLQVLRGQIDSLDVRLLQTLAERFRVCKEVGEIKEQLGLPMMQPERIRQVTDRIAQRAGEHGVAPPFARTLWELIIAEACRLETVKDRAGYAGDGGGHADHEFAEAIVIGAGAIGSLLGQLLTSSCQCLRFFDLHADRGVPQGDATAPAGALLQALRRADLVVLALPESVVERALGPISCSVPAGALIVETTSIKSRMPGLRAQISASVELLGINPLFGPGLGVAGRTVCVTEYDGGSHSRAFRRCLLAQQLRIVEVSPARHDDLMSTVQVATHATILAFAHALAHSGTDLLELQKVATPPFRTLLLLAARLMHQGPDVYWGIQASNPGANAARARLLAGAARCAELTRDPGDPAGFRDWFATLAHAMEPAMPALTVEGRALLGNLGRG